MRPTGCMVMAVWAFSASVAWAQDPTDLDHDGVFVDDGEPIVDDGLPVGPICNLPVDDAATVWWDDVGRVRIALPATVAGDAWTIELRAANHTTQVSWTEYPVGSPSQTALHTVTLPASVGAASAADPMVLTARAVLTGPNGVTSTEDLDQVRVARAGNQTTTSRASDWVPRDVTLDGETVRLANYKDIPYPPPWSGGPPPTTGPALVCAWYQPRWTDADLAYDYGLVAGVQAMPQDDFLTDNDDLPARGALIKVVDLRTGLVQADYAAIDGPEAGCAWFALAPNERYDIWMLGSVLIDTVELRTHEKAGAPTWADLVLPGYVHGGGSGPIDVYGAAGHHAWDVQAVTSWAVFRRRAGLAGHVFHAYSNGIGSCSAGAAACTIKGDTYFSKTASAHKRYYVGHEMGHAVGFVEDDEKSPNHDYDSERNSPTKCAQGPRDGHWMTSKEYSSAAAVEGWAHYYAALTFNRTDQSDCTFVFNKSADWDGDGAIDAKAKEPFDCDGAPMWAFTPASVSDDNYYADVCVSPPVDDRGTEYDWLRFFWDLSTDEGLTFGDVASVWDAANPKNWDKNGGGLFASDDPWDRVSTNAPAALAASVIAQGSMNGVDN
ncbi:MAG: hypothetical protein ABMB14_19695 [Myxococcota bacterium]